jgi:hypothetical protein
MYGSCGTAGNGKGAERGGSVGSTPVSPWTNMRESAVVDGDAFGQIEEIGEGD